MKCIQKKQKKKITKYSITNLYDNLVINNNDSIEYNNDNLQNTIYEEDYFDLIPITGDGNCFFRSLSYYLNGDENSHKTLRDSAYHYVKKNITRFYEYCYVENDLYYIDIKEGRHIRKYILDDYVENIKISKFFSGFIEINAMSIILNRPIVILEDLYYNAKKFYKKLAVFNNSDFNSILVDDIIFINFQNNNHYELLLPKKNFIKDRINKIALPEVNQLIIVNIQNNTNITNNINKKDDNKKRKIEKTNDKDRSSKDDKNKDKDEAKKPAKYIDVNNGMESTILEKEQNQYDKFEISSKFKNLFIDLNLYYKTLQNYDDFTKIITDKKGNIIKYIPKYPVLIGKKVNENYYADIFRYLYVSNNDLDISRYSNKINNIKKVVTRDNKKREFRKKIQSFYLDENNVLYKKILVKDKDKLENQKIIIENTKNYVLLKIPETLDILTYLMDLYIADGHRGIVSLREYLYNNNIYLEGSSFLTEYIVKCCKSCAEKNKTKYVREPAKQIITYYPKQRYIMDLTEIPLELKSNNNYNYLFDIIDHFSKFGISIPIENKDSKTILNNLKIALECNGFPEEIGCDNGKEFRNNLIESYLKDKNIKLIHGLPYNPHSQGVVERFHKTIKDYLYSIYSDDNENFDLKQCIDIVIKKYNNHKHRSTKYTPNEIFYSKDEELYSKVLDNIKSIFNSFKYENANFKENEKCLLKCKFIIKKFFKEKKDGVLTVDKVKKKIGYRKLNVIVLGKCGSNYRIKISKNYPDYKFKKDDICLVDYKLLNKCSSQAWNKLLNETKNNDDIPSDESFESNESISEEEVNYIQENKNEFN